jgi:hypothetical protein
MRVRNPGTHIACDSATAGEQLAEDNHFVNQRLAKAALFVTCCNLNYRTDYLRTDIAVVAHRCMPYSLLKWRFEWDVSK